MKTIEYWNYQKRHLMRVLRYARAVHSKKGIETYSKAVNKCDVKIGVISAMRRMVGVVILLAFLFVAGCQTFKGATGDTAWMLQKLSDNVQVDKEK